MIAMGKLDPPGIREDHDELLELNARIMEDIEYTFNALGETGKYESYFTSHNLLRFLSYAETVLSEFLGTQIEKYSLAPQKQMFDEVYIAMIESISDIKQKGDDIANDSDNFKAALLNGQKDVA